MRRHHHVRAPLPSPLGRTRVTDPKRLLVVCGHVPHFRTKATSTMNIDICGRLKPHGGMRSTWSQVPLIRGCAPELNPDFKETSTPHPINNRSRNVISEVFYGTAIGNANIMVR